MAFISTKVRFFAVAFFLWAGLAQGTAWAQNSKNLAPGFETRAANATVVLMAPDIELFSISGGGVMEPRADWTEAAGKHFKDALEGGGPLTGTKLIHLSDKDMDQFGEVNALHGAMAQSIFYHHMLGALKLPTKNGVLDWSMGDSISEIKAKTNADYALFTWFRDSYASAERKAAMIALAMLGIGIGGGAQVGYASLVDLNTGRVVWFNGFRRGAGDLREAKYAKETLEELLKSFPPAK